MSYSHSVHVDVHVDDASVTVTVPVVHVVADIDECNSPAAHDPTRNWYITKNWFILLLLFLL